MSKNKYSSSERRNFWIGVGRSLAEKDAASKKANESLSKNQSAKDRKSYENGLMATVHNPNILDKKNKKSVSSEKKNDTSVKTTTKSKRPFASLYDDFDYDCNGHIKGEWIDGKFIPD